MTQVLQSLGAQTLRLLADRTVPVVAGLRGAGNRCIQRTTQGMASIARPPGVRAIAVGALALMLGSAATAVALVYFNDARSSEPVPVAGAPPTSGPVKIIDASPRGESCDEQVWPYIEQRCLKRAAAPPQVVDTAPAAVAPTPSPAPMRPVPRPEPVAAEAPPAVPPVAVAEPAAAPEPRPEEDLRDAALLAGAAAGVGAAQMAVPQKRAERRRSVRRTARRHHGFRLPIFGLRF